MESSILLKDVGGRVRSARAAAGWTLRDVADRSGVSTRFLSELESGRANISVARLADVAGALGVPLFRLLPADMGMGTAIERIGALLEGCSRDDLDALALWLEKRLEQPQRPLVALVGLRGAGKSTIGPALASSLKVPFLELDALIEEESNLSLSELFSLHGESYYKRLAHDLVLRLLARNEAMVVATGGSIVTDPETWSLLKRRTHTVWLKASPDDHWKRVLGQGDTRPMANRRSAMSELRSILSIRSPLYAEAAQTIDTSDIPVRTAVNRIASAVRDIDAAWRNGGSNSRGGAHGRERKARPA